MDDTAADIVITETMVCGHCGLAVRAGVVCCDRMPLEASSEIEEIQQKFELLQAIGHGNTSVVYKARHRLMGNTVAVKLLKAKLESDDLYVKRLKRFHQEATLLTRLNEDSVIKVIDFGALSQGQAFIVMEFFEGKTLSKRLESVRRFSSEKACEIGIKVATALAHAHSYNLMHRDLKPSNILINDDGIIKLVDFGIARFIEEESETPRLTQTGEVFGTPAYMSPEQCQGMPQDARSDIYSLGCVLYELLTGLPPFCGDNPLQVMFQHADAQARPRPIQETVPLADGNLDWCVQKMLEKNPDHRHQSMDEVLNDLRAISAGEPPLSLKGRRRAKSIPAPERNRNLLFMGAGSILVFSAVALFCFLSTPAMVVPKELFADARAHVGTPASAFTDAVVDASIRDAQMPVVDLQNTSVTNRCLSTLLTIKGLKNLRVDYTAIDDDGIRRLADHPTLELLEMRGGRVTDKVFATFARIPNLNHFSVARCEQVTGNSLPLLAACHNLTSFSLREIGLRDSTLAGLPVLPTLRKVHIDCNPLTDAAVPALLVSCPNIDFLDMEHTQISDAGLEKLAASGHIRSIQAGGCPNITDAGVKRIQKKYPACDITLALK